MMMRVKTLSRDMHDNYKRVLSFLTFEVSVGSCQGCLIFQDKNATITIYLVRLPFNNAEYFFLCSLFLIIRSTHNNTCFITTSFEID